MGFSVEPGEGGYRPRRFRRSRVNREVAGVCGGAAEYLGLDGNLVRLAFVALVLLTGVAGGVAAYALLWLLVPENLEQEDPGTYGLLPKLEPTPPRDQAKSTDEHGREPRAKFDG